MAVHSFELSNLIFSYARYFVLVIVLVIPDILFWSLAFVVNNSQRNNSFVLQITALDGQRIFIQRKSSLGDIIPIT